MEIRASWPEEVDRGPDGVPVTVQRSAVVLSHRLAPDAVGALPAVSDVDARRRVDLDTDALGLPGHELGTTGHRVVTYRAVATTIDTDCYPPDVVSVSEEGPMVVDLPSTAAPPAPGVSDVVPSQSVLPQRSEHLDPTQAQLFPDPAPPDLITQTDQEPIVQERSGGLRLYLEQPWHVSGSGELLAVLVADPATAPTTGPPTSAGQWVALDDQDLLRGRVSQWGQDPSRRTVGVNDFRPERFGGAVASGPWTLPATPDGAKPALPVILLGYQPEFEPGSGRWFVDLRIDTSPT